MKIHHPLATAAIMAMSTTTVSAIKKKSISSAKHRNSFVKAMRTSHERRGVAKDQTPTFKSFAKDMSGNSKRARNLRKKVMEKAKPVGEEHKRHLQNYNQANNNNANAYGNNANANSQKDGADDFFVTYGEWDNSFGFDPTQYSLSYHRCAAVKQFDDQLAAQEDSTSVFSTKNFAVFRFCPSKTCGGIGEDPQEAYQNGQQGANYNNGAQQGASYDNGQYNFQFGQSNMFEYLKVAGANGEGCQSNYGEYMLELGDYLDLMVCLTVIMFYTTC